MARAHARSCVTLQRRQNLARPPPRAHDYTQHGASVRLLAGRRHALRRSGC